MAVNGVKSAWPPAAQTAVYLPEMQFLEPEGR